MAGIVLWIQGTIATTWTIKMKDFLRYMHDVVILLGGDRRIAELLNHPELITEQDVEDVRRYAGQLVDATKTKLISINTITVKK